jgi:demethylmenaquinone methyltransferase/2-methoxy-6-polyprenyl-1,4-benzoquinol methylase
VRGVFNRTAGDYDRVERAMSAGSGPWYRRQALLRAGLAPGMQVLDVATGTGLVAKEAVQIVGPEGAVVGADPSLGMIAAGALPSSIRAVGAAAERLPFADARFDFLSMGFALRHVADLAAVFAEFARVLKPGGRVCILEITRPAGRLGMLALKGYMRGIVPLVARVVGREAETAQLMRYYWDTIQACVPPAEVMTLLKDAGFTGVERYVELGIFSEYRAVRD